jgi:hypothetical protein
MKPKKLTRAQEMKLEKKLKIRFKILGLITGGTVGCFISYQLAQLSSNGPYDDVSTLSFFLSLFGGSIGSLFGFAMATFTRQNNIRG